MATIIDLKDATLIMSREEWGGLLSRQGSEVIDLKRSTVVILDEPIDMEKLTDAIAKEYVRRGRKLGGQSL